jgi:hypothetical protein
MTESNTELKMYSSFCCFEQEAIEQALKEAGINYRIERFQCFHDLDCFNLFAKPNVELDVDLQSIELEIVRKYREQFNLEHAGLYELQAQFQNEV